VSIPYFIANSLTTWAQFLPGTLCSFADYYQLMVGGAEGCALISSRNACLSQVTLLKSGECALSPLVWTLWVEEFEALEQSLSV